MTGQVKEELITRFGELGVMVEDGELRFAPTLIDRDEFLSDTSVFHYVNTAGARAVVDVPAGAMAFTYCQTPVIYRLAGNSSIEVVRTDRRHEIIAGDRLSRSDSAAVLSRQGSIARIEVTLNESQLRCSRQTLPGFQELPSQSAAPVLGGGDGMVE
jgi:hypothetical protein